MSQILRVFRLVFEQCSHFLHIYIYIYQVVTLVYLDKRYVILGDISEFANILQSMKIEKSVKDLTFRVELESLRKVWQLFDTFFIF